MPVLLSLLSDYTKTPTRDLGLALRVDAGLSRDLAYLVALSLNVTHSLLDAIKRAHFEKYNNVSLKDNEIHPVFFDIAQEFMIRYSQVNGSSPDRFYKKNDSEIVVQPIEIDGTKLMRYGNEVDNQPLLSLVAKEFGEELNSAYSSYKH